MADNKAMQYARQIRQEAGTLALGHETSLDYFGTCACALRCLADRIDAYRARTAAGTPAHPFHEQSEYEALCDALSVLAGMDD